MRFNTHRKWFIDTSNMISKFLKLKWGDMGRLCALEFYCGNIIGIVLSYSIKWNEEVNGRVGDRLFADSSVIWACELWPNPWHDRSIRLNMTQFV